MWMATAWMISSSPAGRPTSGRRRCTSTACGPDSSAKVPQSAGIVLPSGAVVRRVRRRDNDGWLDLFAIGGDGRGYLFHNAGNGTFTDVTAKAGISDVHGARRGVFVDLDHDGDLDLLLVGASGRAVYRNNLDGTFTRIVRGVWHRGDDTGERRRFRRLRRRRAH